ncbi:MAG TPA: WhiB family transcriptional regulator [Mycobacteriales bacterium]|nr:WhiB family transcriptional regulator [Mycobacteriales bacterium]
MSRQTGAVDLTRVVRRDPRFRAAQEKRIPEPDWRSRGECLRHDPETFFPNAAEDPAPAIEICRSCTVVGPCLAAALDSGECDGVWGATTPEERRTMRDVWLRQRV